MDALECAFHQDFIEVALCQTWLVILRYAWVKLSQYLPTFRRKLSRPSLHG